MFFTSPTIPKAQTPAILPAVEPLSPVSEDVLQKGYKDSTKQCSASPSSGSYRAKITSVFLVTIFHLSI